jgi:molybdopterin molybdotransferase
MGRKVGKREFVRCTLAVEKGGLIALRHPRGGAGMLSSIAESDGLVEIGEQVAAVTVGMTVPFIPFSAWGL